MKDNSHDLRRVGKPGMARRIHAGNQLRLSELFGGDGEQMHQPAHRPPEKDAVHKPHTTHNWRVISRGKQAIAIEPNKEFENIFEGGDDPLLAALEYAAAELKKGMPGG